MRFAEGADPELVVPVVVVHIAILKIDRPRMFELSTSAHRGIWPQWANCAESLRRLPSIFTAALGGGLVAQRLDQIIYAHWPARLDG